MGGPSGGGPSDMMIYFLSSFSACPSGLKER